MMTEEVPTVRYAARVVLLDETDRVLLVRFEYSGRSWWMAPGGGLNEGETHEDAARREVKEATMRVGARRNRRPSGALSMKSSLSILSYWSVGSILSFGSVLSIGSAGSILSAGSVGSILSIGAAGSRPGPEEEPEEGER